MNDYNEMTDLEINREVAKNRHGYQGDVGDWLINGVKASSGDGFTYYEADFCNNPSDAWPIIFANKIATNPQSSGELWLADVNAESAYGFSKLDKNPLRAAMIVFLMMNEEGL